MVPNLVKETKFYVSLAYGALTYKLGRRSWYDRVNEKVVLGALPILPDWDSIREKENITHVVSMVEPFEVKSFVLGHREATDRGIHYISLPVEDFTGVPTVEQIDTGLDFIDSCTRAGESVYVHCKAGRTRSAFVVVCYLMSSQGLDPEQAHAHVQASRPHIIFTAAHWRALRHYHDVLLQRRQCQVAPAPGN